MSVSPLTTHLPIKKVSKTINENLIKSKIKLIEFFFKTHLKRKAKIAITGLNPHCESIDSFNEDEKIIKPTVKALNKSDHRIFGPFAADIVPTIDNAPSLVSNPKIINQLPYISE